MIEVNMKVQKNEKVVINEIVPIVPLRDIVVFPYMAIPLFVGRDKSIAAIKEAHSNKQNILLVSQKIDDIEYPEIKDLYEIGTYTKILQLMKLPDGTFKVLVEGIRRAKINKYFNDFPFIGCKIHLIKYKNDLNENNTNGFIKALLSSFKILAELSGQISKEVLTSIISDNYLPRIIDTVTAQIQTSIEKKQSILESTSLNERSSLILQILISETEILNLERNIKERVKSQVEKNQKEYYLNEQLKAIYKEMGDVDDFQEYDLLKEKIEKSQMSKESTEKAFNELKKLRSMPPSSAESSVSRNYIEVLLNLPWLKRNRIKKNLCNAKKILNQDHFGLKKIKERILEYLAVQQRMKKIKGPILCLIGPPGVGKTSLGKSIAKATGRKYIRMALGGIKDEAEIRGHRRTYIGALPGQIIQKINKVNVNNPLFLLDEIDKMSYDFRGDPASAMLEVLDPEQNNTFNDHYLEIDYDLSNIMFIATANSTNIREALKDRMEIIYLSGYTEEEKNYIGKYHLIPKSIKENGLRKKEIYFENNILNTIIRYYTRESGIRNLQKEINKICRKVVKIILSSKNTNYICIKEDNIIDYIGIKKYSYGKSQKENMIGKVTGLAWTEVGGDLLFIESVVTSGKGKLKLTGHLGEVMKESIHAAFTIVRIQSKKYNISENFYEKHNFHIHVPEGATPKDGPSAGIAMCTAILSSILKTPIHKNIAMTGEITLEGNILPIGGLKEKLLAALRGNIKKVLIPYKNKKDLKDISKNVLSKIKILFVKTIDNVFNKSLLKE